MRFNLDFLIVPSCDLDMTANVHVKKMADIFCINTQKSDLTWFHNNINFYNINELIKRGYDFSINTITDSTDKTQKLLEQFLQKSDALDEKLTRIENNLKMQIRDIKVNLESHKLQGKHETDNIKNALDDVEKSQDLILQKSEEQNIKIGKLMQDNKKLSMENSELNSKINNLIEQQE